MLQISQVGSHLCVGVLVNDDEFAQKGGKVILMNEDTLKTTFLWVPTGTTLGAVYQWLDHTDDLTL